MVALKTERQVYLWHVEAHPLPRKTPVSVSLDEVLEIIDAAFVVGDARAYLAADGSLVDTPINDDGSKNCIYLADMAIDESTGIRTILVNRGDPDAANPAFIAEDLIGVRPIEPEDGEVQGWSAHMVLRQAEPDHLSYRACFERMQNVSSTLVEKLFSHILDKHTKSNPKYTYDHVVNRGRKKVIERRPYRIRLGVKRVPADKIIDDLDKGELSGITLINSSPEYAGPAAPEIVKSVKHTLEIRTADVDKSKLSNFVKNVTNWGKQNNYNEIQFDLRNLPSGGSASPRFSIEKSDAMETLYVRSQKISGFSSFLERCHAAIDEDIRSKMVELITDDDVWIR